MAPPYPRFFCIILQRTLEDRQLTIPKKFVNQYGKFLPSSISLMLPDGLEWKVGLSTSTNGTVCLKNGWHRFSEHYGLKFGSFLVFKFYADSTFHTHIMDPTGLEIDYYRNINDSQGDHEILELNPSFPKTEPDEEEQYPLSREMPGCKRKPREMASTSSQPFSSKAMKVEAENEFSSLKSDKTGFKVFFGKSAVFGRYSLIIPKTFAKEYMTEELGAIEVKNLEGRSWPLLYKWSQSRKIDYAYISSGWKDFAQENHLKEGDIGFFEMIKKDHFLFTLEGTSSSPPITPKNNNVASGITKTPSFNVNIHIKSFKSSVLNIPLTFADNHLSSTINTAKLVVGNKQWKVRIKHYERCIRFSAGWPTFYWQNGLQNGDSCVFQLVSKIESKCVFKVTIFKNPSTSISSG